MNLYKKYRPPEFDQVIGNEDVVSYLQDVVSDVKTCPNVFLLYGPTGCGKTTLGRIIAWKLGSKGTDMMEINTADFRGIDTARQIIRNSNYRPMEGGVRMWLIDEVHKMTGDAQTALLKLLEDTPKKSFFVLCTTEPHKLLATIKGRCIQLEVKPLTEQQMFRLLKSVVKQEGKKIDKEVYEQIVQDSFGLPRNALQILERVLKVSKEKQLELAKQSAVEYSQSIELCRILLGQGRKKANWKEVRTILLGMKDQEAESIRRHVLAYNQSVLLNGDNARSAFIIEEFSKPFYDSGFPMLVFACYSIVKG